MNLWIAREVGLKRVNAFCANHFFVEIVILIVDILRRQGARLSVLVSCCDRATMSSYGISPGRRSPFCNISSAISRRTSDADRAEGINLIPFSPLGKHYSDTDDFDELYIAPRDYGRRQAYLRTYTFTRASPKTPMAPEKVKKSLTRLKAAAWAVVACKYRLPLRVRVIKEKMLIKSSQYLTNGVHYLRPSCMQMPKCVMAGG